MKSFPIEFSSSAESDLSNIWEYLFLYNEEIADSFILEITDRVKDLKMFPFLGSVHEDLENGERYVVHKKYDIIYEVKDKKIFILRILHSSREIKKFL